MSDVRVGPDRFGRYRDSNASSSPTPVPTLARRANPPAIQPAVTEPSTATADPRARARRCGISRNATAVSATGCGVLTLPGGTTGGDQVPTPVAPFPGQGDRNYAVASSSAPVRSARI